MEPLPDLVRGPVDHFQECHLVLDGVLLRLGLDE
jgi:hypothetical protein